MNRLTLFSSYLLHSPISMLLIVAMFSRLLDSAIVPIWHTPDEQAHFAQIAYFAEFGVMPQGDTYDLNNEIYISEVILSTNRDNNGNNRYTYHPEYNIEYTNSTEGKYEKIIKEIDLKDRKKLVKQEAARYPPLYYFVASVIYRFFYDSDLITRVYAVRFISIIFSLATIVTAYLIGNLLFNRNYLLSLTLAVLVAFQPMLTFVSVGVTSDNLLNLLFSIVIYLGLLIIRNGVKKIYIILGGLLLVSLYFTKPQFILSIPILFLALTIRYLLLEKTKRKYLINTVFFMIGLIILAIFYFGSKDANFYEKIQKFYAQDYFPGQSRNAISVIDYLKLTVNKTVHETIPWYFGVFKWLGIVLPIEILRIINRILIFIALGIIVKLFLSLRNRDMENLMFIFLLLSSLIYFVGIIYYDFLVFSRLSFSFGLQGRYFFPLIVAHMALLIMGLRALHFKKLDKYIYISIKILGILMICLGLITVIILARGYYSLESFNTFITQASQYKPWFFKGGWLVFWIVLYLVILFVFIFRYLKLSTKLDGKKFL